MRCEFTIDDTGSIWFMFAQDIWVRPSTIARMAMEAQVGTMKKQVSQQKLIAQNQKSAGRTSREDRKEIAI